MKVIPQKCSLALKASIVLLFLPLFLSLLACAMTEVQYQRIREWSVRLRVVSLDDQSIEQLAPILAEHGSPDDTGFINSLDHATLESFGVLHAGNRARILLLKKTENEFSALDKQLDEEDSSTIVEPVREPQMNNPLCFYHRTLIASDRCQDCRKFICTHCRVMRTHKNNRSVKCQKCDAECVIL